MVNDNLLNELDALNLITTGKVTSASTVYSEDGDLIGIDISYDNKIVMIRPTVTPVNETLFAVTLGVTVR